MNNRDVYKRQLCDMGFKEIEIGFPSASETEYEICREMCIRDRTLAPDLLGADEPSSKNLRLSAIKILT